MIATVVALQSITEHEGYVPEPYLDTVDLWTIGYGRNLEYNPLSLEEVLALFDAVEFKSEDHAKAFFEMLAMNDIDKVINSLRLNLAMWPMCSEDEQLVLVDMGYNIGVQQLLKFRGMLSAIDNDDATAAATELLDSKYATQVKTRAVKNAKILAGSENSFNRAVASLKVSNPKRYEAIEPYLDKA